MVEFGMLVWGLLAALLCCALLGVTVTAPSVLGKRVMSGERAGLARKNAMLAVTGDMVVIARIDGAYLVYCVVSRVMRTDTKNSKRKDCILTLDNGSGTVERIVTAETTCWEYAVSASAVAPPESVPVVTLPCVPVKANVPQTTAKVAPKRVPRAYIPPEPRGSGTAAAIRGILDACADAGIDPEEVLCGTPVVPIHNGRGMNPAHVLARKAIREEAEAAANVANAQREAAAQNSSPSVNVCPKCKTYNRLDATICAACSATLGAQPSTPVVSVPETSPGVLPMTAKKLTGTDRIKAAQEERASKRREPASKTPSLQEAESLLRGGGFSEDEVRVMVAALAARREGIPAHQNVTTPAVEEAKSETEAPKVRKVRKQRGAGKPIVQQSAAQKTSKSAKAKASKPATKATTSSVAEGPFAMTERAFYMACRGHGLSAKETCEAAAGLKFAPNVKLANDSSYYNRKVTEKGGTIPALSKAQLAEVRKIVKASAK